MYINSSKILSVIYLKVVCELKCKNSNVFVIKGFSYWSRNVIWYNSNKISS